MTTEPAKTTTTNIDEPSSQRTTVLMLALSVVMLLAFSSTLSSDFLSWDDARMVVDNADLRPGGWPAIARYWLPSHPHLNLYAPATYTLYFLLAQVGFATGGSLVAWPFHVCSVLLHLIAGWLLGSILRRTLRSPSAAVAGVAIFWLHPIQVEAVAWIASLNTVLAATLLLGALNLYTRAAIVAKPASRRVAYLGSCVLFLLATLAKPSVVGGPFAALAIDRYLLALPWREAFRRVVPWALLALPSVIVGRLAQPASTVFAPGMFGRIWVAADAIGFYLWHVIVPRGFAIDYGRAPEWVCTFPSSSVVFASIAVMAAVATGIVARRQRAALAVALVFVAGLLPVLGLVPFAFQTYSTVGDRYLYPSMVAIAIAVACVVRRSRWVGKGIFPVAVILAVCAYVQAGHWSNDGALFDRAFAVNPTGDITLYGRAYRVVTLAGRLPDSETRRAIFRETIEEYKAAIQARPRDGRLRLDLANLYAAAYEFPDACDSYAAALAVGTNDEASTRAAWGSALLELGNAEEAIQQLRLANELDPDNPATLVTWANAELLRGDPQAAAREARRVLARWPKDSRATRILERARATAATMHAATQPTVVLP